MVCEAPRRKKLTGLIVLYCSTSQLLDSLTKNTENDMAEFQRIMESFHSGGNPYK